MTGAVDKGEGEYKLVNWLINTAYKQIIKPSVHWQFFTNELNVWSPLTLSNTSPHCNSNKTSLQTDTCDSEEKREKKGEKNEYNYKT